MLKEIVERIAHYNKIIIHRHERPDPDAIGSQAGLAEIIRYTFPEKQVYIVGEEEESLSFLAKMDEISDDTYQGALVIVTDTANTERISDKRYEKGDFLIKIDHHPNEEPYGDIVWVDTKASSTSEMIFHLYKHSDGVLRLNERAALLLYAGIVGDTGRFLYPNTTPTTHRYISELLEYGIDFPAFYVEFYRQNLRTTRLEGYVLQNFELHDGVVGVMKLPRELLEKFQVTANESAILVNCFSNVEGLLAWVFFVEDENNIRVRLRSRGPKINLLAQKYRGGGHPLASGAKASSWEEADKIVEELRALCKEYKES